MISSWWHSTHRHRRDDVPAQPAIGHPALSEVPGFPRARRRRTRSRSRCRGSASLLAASGCHWPFEEVQPPAPHCPMPCRLSAAERGIRGPSGQGAGGWLASDRTNEPPSRAADRLRPGRQQPPNRCANCSDVNFAEKQALRSGRYECSGLRDRPEYQPTVLGDRRHPALAGAVTFRHQPSLQLARAYPPLSGVRTWMSSL
jgi:hypothetical protein